MLFTPSCVWFLPFFPFEHLLRMVCCFLQVVLFIPNFIGKTSDARAVLKDKVGLLA